MAFSLRGFLPTFRAFGTGGRVQDGGVASTGTTGPNAGALEAAARLAATQPGLSQAEFRAQMEALGFQNEFQQGGIYHPGFGRNVGGARIRGALTGRGPSSLWGVYTQLSGGGAPRSAEEVTSPEPEGPGRFQATRPGDLLGAAELRFGAE